MQIYHWKVYSCIRSADNLKLRLASTTNVKILYTLAESSTWKIEVHLANALNFRSFSYTFAIGTLRALQWKYPAQW